MSWNGPEGPEGITAQAGVPSKILSHLGIPQKVCERWKQARDDFEMDAEADGEILMYGAIVSEAERGFYEDWLGDTSVVTALSVKERLNAFEGDVTLRMNCPGGNYWEGAAIHSLLLDAKDKGRKIYTRIDGLAASAATFVMLVSDKITAAPLAELMIHRAWGMQVGNANDFLEMADFLERTDGQMAELYAAKTGKSKDEMLAEMDKESWYTAPDALALGLIDEVKDKKTISAQEQDDAMFTKRNLRLAAMVGTR